MSWLGFNPSGRLIVDQSRRRRPQWQKIDAEQFGGSGMLSNELSRVGAHGFMVANNPAIQAGLCVLFGCDRKESAVAGRGTRDVSLKILGGVIDRVLACLRCVIELLFRFIDELLKLLVTH